MGLFQHTFFSNQSETISFITIHNTAIINEG